MKHSARKSKHQPCVVVIRHAIELELAPQQLNVDSRLQLILRLRKTASAIETARENAANLWFVAFRKELNRAQRHVVISKQRGQQALRQT